jgi:hypothetical protein
MHFNLELKDHMQTSGKGDCIVRFSEYKCQSFQLSLEVKNITKLQTAGFAMWSTASFLGPWP